MLDPSLPASDREEVMSALYDLFDPEDHVKEQTSPSDQL
jgi:hypothetical protein